MAYFLRFTETPMGDLNRNTSLLALPSMEGKTEVLEGLCGFSFADYEEYNYIMTAEEIVSKVKMYTDNCGYANRGQAVIFEGEYVEQNCNGEGVIFSAESIEKIF